MKSKDNIGFWRSVTDGFKDIIQFKGCTGRRGYFSYVLFLFVLTLLLFILTFKLFDIPDEWVFRITKGFVWGFVLLTLSATYRRFQDVKKPGILAFAIPAAFYFMQLINENPFEWSQIIYFACIGVITYCIVLLFGRSKREDDGHEST